VLERQLLIVDEVELRGEHVQVKETSEAGGTRCFEARFPEASIPAATRSEGSVSENPFASNVHGADIQAYVHARALQDGAGTLEIRFVPLAATEGEVGLARVIELRAAASH